MANKEALKQKSKFSVCDICNVTCSSVVTLYEHVIGQKHRLKAKDTESLLLNQLQYFIDTYVKHEPLVGLEYVVEMQRAFSKYRYRCLLCNFHGDQKPLLAHVSGPEHIVMYVERHHPQKLLDPARYPKRADYTRAMQIVAAKICRLHGKKTIKEILPDMYTDPTPQRMPRYSSDPPATTPKSNHSNGEECPAGFKGNADFLDYLQNFQIQGDTDASIIRQITENCVQALLRYQNEQQELLGGSPAPNNRTGKGLSVGNYGKVVPRSEAPTDATQLVSSGNYGKVVPRSEAATDATQLVSSGNYGKVVPRSEAPIDASQLFVNSGNCEKVVPTSEEPTGNYGKVVPTSEAPTGNYGKVVPTSGEPTDAIEMFFNSIKNMEEADVVKILQKIVATNPAFRGIDVPTVIKYLQATGRLKPS